MLPEWRSYFTESPSTFNPEIMVKGSGNSLSSLSAIDCCFVVPCPQSELGFNFSPVCSVTWLMSTWLLDSGFRFSCRFWVEPLWLSKSSVSNLATRPNFSSSFDSERKGYLVDNTLSLTVASRASLPCVRDSIGAVTFKELNAELSSENLGIFLTSFDVEGDTFIERK